MELTSEEQSILHHIIAREKSRRGIVGVSNTTVQFYIPESYREQLLDMASSEGVSLSEIGRRAIGLYLMGA